MTNFEIKVPEEARPVPLAQLRGGDWALDPSHRDLYAVLWDHETYVNITYLGNIRIVPWEEAATRPVIPVDVEVVVSFLEP